jgi:hypothetical protein
MGRNKELFKKYKEYLDFFKNGQTVGNELAYCEWLEEKLVKAISGLESVKAQTHEDSWANQIVVQHLYEIANCG